MTKLYLILNLVLSGVLSMNRGSYVNNVSPDITKTNKIEIRYLKADRPLKYVIADNKALSFFTYLIKTGKSKTDLKCDSTGEILFFDNSKQLFKIYFSSKATGSKLPISAMVYRVNNHTICSLLTYNVGMDIDEIFYKLKAKH